MRFALITAALFAATTGTGGAALAQPQATHSITPGQIRVLVLNGTQRPGLAARTSAALAKRGFAIQTLSRPWIANAPEPVFRTEIYFDPAQPRARVAAERLQRSIGPRSAIRAITKPIARLAVHAGRPLVVIVLGGAFRGLS